MALTAGSTTRTGTASTEPWLVVLTMAGSSSRFARVGVMSPKWAIRIAGRTVFEHAVAAVAPLLDAGAELRVVVQRSDCEMPDFLAAADRIGRPFTVARVAGNLPGQAIDAGAALTAKDTDRPLVVWGTDVLLGYPDLLGRVTAVGASNWVLTSPLEVPPGASVRLGANHAVDAFIAAPEPGSQALVGMYGLTSARSARALVVVNQGQSRLELTSLHSRLAARGAATTAIEVPPSTVLPIKTPDQMIAVCRSQGWAIPVELSPYLAGRRR